MTNTEKALRVAVRAAQLLTPPMEVGFAALALEKLQQAVAYLESEGVEVFRLEQKTTATRGEFADCEKHDGGPDEGYRDAS